MYVIAKRLCKWNYGEESQERKITPDYLSGPNVISCALKSGRTLNVLGPQSGSFSQLLFQGRRINQRDAMTEEEVGDFQRVREIQPI